MKKKELKALADELGAVLTSEGPVWVATFPDHPSLAHEGPVVLRGLRSRLGKDLQGIKEARRLHKLYHPDGHDTKPKPFEGETHDDPRPGRRARFKPVTGSGEQAD